MPYPCHCGADMECKSTRRRQQGVVRRYHCTRCDARATTREVPVSGGGYGHPHLSEEAQDMAAALNEIEASLQQITSQVALLRKAFHT